MQEEVENKSVQLAVKTTKVTAVTLYRALKACVRHMKNKTATKVKRKDIHTKGKQSVKKLIGQGETVNSMEFGDEGVKDFKKIANKYGVDFAIVKNKEPDSPKYVVFFKARDADAIDQVQQECAAKLKKKKEHSQTKKPSVLQKLKKFKEKVASKPRKQKEKKKEHER
ncbi:MAG: PcfB family protein [Lachnospiraceae bacterium]|nr:PcfB family protein [Lachnospiraceae bacterium]